MADMRIEQIEYLLNHHSSTLEALIHRTDQLEARIGGVAASVVHLERQMAQGFAEIKQNQRTMLDLMMSKFGAIDSKFGEIDKKFGEIDKKFGAIDKKFGAIDSKFGEIDKKFGAIDSKLNQIVALIQNLR